MPKRGVGNINANAKGIIVIDNNNFENFVITFCTSTTGSIIHNFVSNLFHFELIWKILLFDSLDQNSHPEFSFFSSLPNQSFNESIRKFSKRNGE